MNIFFVIISAFVAFCATNIDDFLLLIVYFAEVRSPVSDGLTTPLVVMGQLLGFSLIVGISLLGLILGKFMPVKYVSLIGFLPIYMGLKEIVKRRGEYLEAKKNPDSDKSDLEGVNLVSNSSSDSKKYVDEESQTTESSKTDDQDQYSQSLKEEVKTAPATWAQCLHLVIHPKALEVAMLTFASGGDNIAIYLPIFASSTDFSILITLIIFYGMLILWCVLAYQLVGDERISAMLEKYGAIIVPFALIAIGVYILSSSVIFDP